jgi:hypothetical protein
MIYTIKIDSEIEPRLAEFNAKLPLDQKIVSLVASDHYLFITTEKKESKAFTPMGLLHDHFKRGPNI